MATNHMESTKTETTGKHRNLAGTPRRVSGTQQREQLLREYKTSGLTQKAFALREDVNYHTLVSWLAHNRPAPCATPRGGASAPAPGFVEIAAPAPRAPLEVILRDGRRVRGEDPAALAALARLLEA